MHFSGFWKNAPTSKRTSKKLYSELLVQLFSAVFPLFCVSKGNVLVKVLEPPNCQSSTSTATSKTAILWNFTILLVKVLLVELPKSVLVEFDLFLRLSHGYALPSLRARSVYRWSGSAKRRQEAISGILFFHAGFFGDRKAGKAYIGSIQMDFTRYLALADDERGFITGWRLWRSKSFLGSQLFTPGLFGLKAYPIYRRKKRHSGNTEMGSEPLRAPPH
jgi:hypothetical protein